MGRRFNRLYQACIENIDQAKGKVFNAGGGPEFSMSLLELLSFLEKLSGRHPIVTTKADWRPGDQKVFVADIHKAKNELHWSPTVSRPKKASASCGNGRTRTARCFSPCWVRN